MRRLLSRPGVVLPRNEDFHYEGPNGGHYQCFARLGLAFTSATELDGIAFWILPYLSGHTPVLLDSWTILSLGLNVHRYAHEQEVETALDARLVDAISHYREPDETIVGRVRSLMTGSRAKALLFISSMKSSGRLARRVTEICRGLGYHDIRIVTLFSAADGTEPNETVLCRLPPEFKRHSRAECPDCPAKPVVPINASTYLLELSAKAKPSRIARDDATAARTFLERYRGREAISVHTTRSDPHRRPRHHMVHIDVPKLMGGVFDEHLRDTVDAQLRGYVDVVVCPAHDGCRELGEACAAMLGLDRPIFADEDTLGHRPDELARLVGSRGILFVDDVVTTGRRLRSYKRRFQDLGLVTSDRNIHVLIGIARTPSSDDLYGIADMAHHPKAFFHSVEQVMLPDWEEDECPWCWERRQFERLASEAPLPESIETRLARLQNPSGLRSGVFACWSNPNADMMALGMESIFGEDIDCAELFFSVASSLQTLRDQSRLVEEFQPPIAYVLSPARYFTGRFYNPLISAAIFRACRLHDLRTAALEGRLARKVGEALAETTGRELKGEILLAVAQRKLPLTASVQAVGLDGDPGLCAVLERLLVSENRSEFGV